LEVNEVGRVSDRYRRQPLLFLVTAFLVVGGAALLVGVMYATVTASSLPAFVPGHTAGLHRTRGQRAQVGILLGGLLLFIGAIIATDLRPKR
jgi:hypothetical protein